MPTIEQLATPLRHEKDFAKITGRVQEIIDARFDVIVAQKAMRMTDNQEIEIHPDEPLLTETGVVDRIDAWPTRTAYRHICARLGIPLVYADKLTNHQFGSVQTLLGDSVNRLAEVDDRTAMFRFLRTDEGLWLRAVLSDRFHALDNDLALRAIGEGLTAAGLADCQVDGDVTLDRLRLRVTVPSISLLVPDLLGDYRMPFSMDPNKPMHAPAGPDETPPVLWAGIEIANSETGGGAFNVAKRAEVAVCRNGLTEQVGFRRQHVGAVLDGGEVNWSDDTRRAALTLITEQVTDTVREFCTVEALEVTANRMRRAKGYVVESPSKAIEIVQQRFELTDDESTSVFDCFARGGDNTVLGIGQAVTAAAQLVDDSDRQAEMEATFWKIVEAPDLMRAATAG